MDVENLQERLASPELARWETVGGILGGILTLIAFRGPDVAPPSLNPLFVVVAIVLFFVAGLGCLFALTTLLPWFFGRSAVRRRQARGAMKGGAISVLIAFPVSLLANKTVFFANDGVGDPSLVWFVTVCGGFGCGAILSALAPFLAFGNRAAPP